MKLKNTVREFAVITFAMLIVSAAVYFFMVPSKIVMGSISGLALVFSQLRDFHVDPYVLSKCHFACDRIFADWEGFWGEDNLHFDPASNLSLDL